MEGVECDGSVGVLWKKCEVLLMNTFGIVWGGGPLKQRRERLTRSPHCVIPLTKNKVPLGLGTGGGYAHAEGETACARREVVLSQLQLERDHRQLGG